MRTATALLATVLLASPAQAQPQVCAATLPITPSGVTARPPETFNSEQDYRWVHSSTNLQGAPATEKFAACLFYNPADDDVSPQLGAFRSALVVNNPSPTVAANVQIELRNRNGVLVSTLNVNLPPDGTFTRGVPELRALANGLGSARVISDQPVVGASLHYADSVLIGGNLITDPDFLQPGEGSMQQLQMSQDLATTLYAGPMPLSNTARFDFLNGNLPFYCVLNTSPNPTTVTAFKGTSNGIALPTVSGILPGFGLFIDLSLWSVAEAFYLSSPGPFDDNGWALVTSSDTPLVGDLFLTDFFGDGGNNLNLGDKFRFGTAMMANNPSLQVTNAELTFQIGPATPRVDSLMGVLNGAVVDVGPVNVTYRDRNGVVVGTRNVPSFLPGQTLRLTPGTPGYPGPTFDGWVNVRACTPGLIGWTMREITRLSGAHFEKVYGEELAGANQREPGRGIPVVVAGANTIRKVAPIARVSPFLAWPSYMNFANSTTPNVGNYFYRFFQVLPLSADVTNYAPQPFAGLRFANTSFTYEDGVNSLINFGVAGFVDQNVSGRVDVTAGSVIGIDVIGDPMDEWQIEYYPDAPGFEPGDPGADPDGDPGSENP